MERCLDRSGHDLIAIFGRKILDRLLSGPQHGRIHLWCGRFTRYSFVVGLLFISHVFLRRRVNPSLRDPVRIESHLRGKCFKAVGRRVTTFSGPSFCTERLSRVGISDGAANVQNSTVGSRTQTKSIDRCLQ
jgi:hypothetical protein